jgi:osmoprotectant transport system permease protein
VAPLVFCALGLLGYVPGFLELAPNRLAQGVPVRLLACAPVWGGLIALALVAMAFSAVRGRLLLGLSTAGALVLLVPLAAGAGAEALRAHAPVAARAELGPGFWLLMAAGVLATMDAAAALELTLWHRLRVAIRLVLGLGLMAAIGRLSALSLAQEYMSHRAAFHAAIGRHVLLVGLSLAGAALVGVPLGLAAWRRRGLRAPLFSALNIVQTLPSIALFGLLITPLSRAGLSGIGVVPAVIALVLYALLPTVRTVVTGLDGVPGAAVDAAAGLGMSDRDVFLQVRLPLAAPALLAGLRVVVVQAVGLAVVAALIGAGGLGDFVFQGLGQYALDLVLLGALPATALALVADAALTFAADVAARKAA